MDSPDHGYDIINPYSSEKEGVSESVNVNDCERDRKTLAVPNINIQKNETVVYKPAIQKDMCNFFSNIPSHNELVMREFPRYSSRELNHEPPRCCLAI